MGSCQYLAKQVTDRRINQNRRALRLLEDVMLVEAVLELYMLQRTSQVSVVEPRGGSGNAFPWYLK
jgi:hypothetical protein